MRYVSAYMLAVLGGKEKPSASDLENILGSVGIDADAEKLKLVISKFAGKSIPELIAEGSKGLVSMAGGATASTAAPAAAAAAAPAAAAAEAKPAKKEEKEESDDDMGFGLFD